MLVLAAAWGMLIAASFIVGAGALSLIDLRSITRPSDRALLAIWLGTIGIATALTAASLFAPLGTAVSWIVVLALVGISLLVRAARALMAEVARSIQPWSVLGLATLALGIAFYCSSQQVSFADTGLYHAGAIEWLARYGAVKGSALLEYRFGFASSWFPLAAAFDLGPVAGRMGTVAGGFALLLAACHFVLSMARVARRDAQLTDWFCVIAYLVALTWILRVGIAISPSPDLPVIILGIVVVWSMLLASNDRTTASLPRRLALQAVPVFLAAGALSIKLSAAPLLFVAFLFYIWGVRPSRQWVVVAAVGGVIVLPTALLSFTVSGCPLFPSPILCVDQPWSLGSAAAAHDQVEGRDFLRWTGAVPPGANALNWLPHWLRAEPVAALAIGYALIALAGLVAFRQIKRVDAAFWVSLIAVAGILYVLAFSPTYRFVLTYAVVPPAYLGAWLCVRSRAHPLVLLPALLTAVASVETVTLTDYHSNGLTTSARLYSLILPVGALSTGVASRINAAVLQPMRWMETPAAATVLGLLIATSSLGLLPSPRPLQHPDNYASALLTPPPMTSVAVAWRKVDDLAYAVPSEGQQCWATVPCSAEQVPSRLHLLNPGEGIRGGLGI